MAYTFSNNFACKDKKESHYSYIFVPKIPYFTLILIKTFPILHFFKGLFLFLRHFFKGLFFVLTHFFKGL